MRAAPPEGGAPESTRTDGSADAAAEPAYVSGRGVSGRCVSGWDANGRGRNRRISRRGRGGRDVSGQPVSRARGGQRLGMSGRNGRGDVSGLGTSRRISRRDISGLRSNRRGSGGFVSRVAGTRGRGVSGDEAGVSDTAHSPSTPWPKPTGSGAGAGRSASSRPEADWPEASQLRRRLPGGVALSTTAVLPATCSRHYERYGSARSGTACPPSAAGGTRARR